MKNRITHIIYILTLTIGCLVVFSGCEYEIDYKGDLPEDRLVITAFTEEDSVISFQITHSAKPGVFKGDNYDDWKKSTNKKKVYHEESLIKNATVTLYDNNMQIIETTSYDDNNGYKFQYIPKPSDDLTIKIHAPGYSDVESRLNFTLSSPAVSVFEYAFKEQEYGWSLIVTIEIDDEGGENYYMFDPYDITYMGMYSIIYSNTPKILYESHAGVYYEQNVTDIDDDERYNEYAVISNSKFAGQKYKIRLEYAADYSSYFNSKELQGCFKVMKIDRNTYSYLYSLGNYINSWGLNINPVSIKNAWDNAYGFIGVIKTKRFAVSVDK